MDALMRHKRRHPGNRPFQCDLCECTFSRADRLAEHKRSHTGEKSKGQMKAIKKKKDPSSAKEYSRIKEVDSETAYK